jgi:hypothetical protein
MYNLQTFYTALFQVSLFIATKNKLKRFNWTEMPSYSILLKNKKIYQAICNTYMPPIHLSVVPTYFSMLSVYPSISNIHLRINLWYLLLPRTPVPTHRYVLSHCTAIYSHSATFSVHFAWPALVQACSFLQAPQFENPVYIW